MGRLDNKVALITGASKGMGRAIADLYLASDESKYVTGVELNVDGGMLAGIAARPK